MKGARLFLLILCFAWAGAFNVLCQNAQDAQRVVIKWLNEKPQGHIEVLNGELKSTVIHEGKGKVIDSQYRFTSSGSDIIDISLKNTRVNYGSGATVVSVYNGIHSFSFFLRDVTYEYPIYIPEYNVVVCRYDDNRSYQQIEEEIKNRQLLTKLGKIEKEPEESFDSAAVHTRNQVCPIWLGYSSF
jgi:hypothetical protein